MIVPDPTPLEDAARSAVRAAHRCDETACVRELAERARMTAAERQATEKLALTLIEAVRGAGGSAGMLDAFLQEYGLSSPEGVVLLCLAEALLRIPDADTADRLIRDKIGGSGRQRSARTRGRKLLAGEQIW